MAVASFLAPDVAGAAEVCGVDLKIRPLEIPSLEGVRAIASQFKPAQNMLFDGKPTPVDAYRPFARVFVQIDSGGSVSSARMPVGSGAESTGNRAVDKALMNWALGLKFTADTCSDIRTRSAFVPVHLDRPDPVLRAGATYSEAEIYSVSHVAAAGYLGMVNFVVGRMSRDCARTLNRKESFAKEKEALWQERNAEYYQSATMLSANNASYHERIEGPASREFVLKGLIDNTRKTGEEFVETYFQSARDKPTACSRFQQEFEQGVYDVTPRLPFYNELNEIVDISRAFAK
jgi:hypothetical protein